MTTAAHASEFAAVYLALISAGIGTLRAIIRKLRTAEVELATYAPISG